MICVAGCRRGRPAVFGGSSGVISFQEASFVNHMECAWKILVDKNKVNHLRNTLFVTRLIETDHSRCTVFVQIKSCVKVYEINIVNNIPFGDVIVYNIVK